MTYWIVTTGDSLRTSSRCWTYPGHEYLYEHDDRSTAAYQDVDDGLSELQMWQQRRRKIVDDGMGPDPKRFQDLAAQSVKNHFRSECWCNGLHHTLPAELATLHRLRDLITPSDTIRLIAGSSNLRVARLLEAILESLATTDKRSFPTRNILCEPTYDLDPLATADFNLGIAGLWAEIRPLLNGVGDTRLVLTGGYKAIAISLALHVGKAVPVPREIYYLYEGADSQVITLKFSGDPANPVVAASLQP